LSARRATHILPDRLAPNLRVWFVGTAASARSAEVRAYYAKPGNRFWPTLHETGITPTLFSPHDYPKLLGLGIGLTDLCKVASGVDAKIDEKDFDAAGFAAKVKRLKPRALAFTSKKAASLFLGRDTGKIALGLQTGERAGGPAIFILASPSGGAKSHWKIKPWQELSDWLRTLPG
jgi:TDG/mug DNA glycosylase family protein